MNKQPEEFKHVFTVGELVDYINKNNIPMDAKIFMQRIEDSYYEGCNISGITGELPDGTYGILPEGSKATPWPTVTKPTYEWYLNLEKIKDIEANREDYPHMTDAMLELLKEAPIELFSTEYTPLHSPVKYGEDNNLYLDAHY
jgi:hypothetical protein